MKEATCCHNTNPACGLKIAIAAKTAWLKEVPPEGPLGTCSFWSFKAGWHLLYPKSSQAQGTMAQLGSIELGPFCLQLPIGERKKKYRKFQDFPKLWKSQMLIHRQIQPRRISKCHPHCLLLWLSPSRAGGQITLATSHTLLLHFSGKPTTSYPVAICTSHYGNEQKSSNYNTLNHTK